MSLVNHIKKHAAMGHNASLSLWELLQNENNMTVFEDQSMTC